MENSLISKNHTESMVVAMAAAGALGDDSKSAIPAMLLENTAYGKTLLIELRGEFDRFCAAQNAARCKTCGEQGCRDKLARLLIHFLNLFTEIAHNERKLIDRYRTNPQYRKALDEHLFAHDKIINDISSYVMDCDRASIDAILNAALSTLVYWTDGHVATHDKLLLDIVSGSARPS